MILAHGALGSYDELIFTGAFLLIFLLVLLSGFFMSRRDARGEAANIDEAVRQSLESNKKQPSETNPPPST